MYFAGTQEIPEIEANTITYFESCLVKFNTQSFIAQNVLWVDEGFDKVFLKKGESKTVTVMLDADAFSYYKIDKKAFGYDPGTFEVIVGASAEDMKLKGSVVIR